MADLTTISKASSDMGVSSRTLRYWEAAGLFKSSRDIQSGWRMYDDGAIQCIRVTNLLRRLDFSISDIKDILEKKTVDSLRHVLRKQLSRLDKTRLEAGVRAESISELITMLEPWPSLSLASLETILLPAVLGRKKHMASKLQGGFSMENVKSKYDEVQFVRLPAARAAAYSCVGTEPEDEAFSVVKEWIVKNCLEGTMRLFGFNAEPYPSPGNPAYGFGFCATIPEGVEIPAPLHEMRLPGGVYAMISQYEGDPSFGWKKVHELCGDSGWEWEYDGSRHGLEEHIERADGKGGFIIPILFPVKKK